MKPIYIKDLEYGSWPSENNDILEYCYDEELEDKFYTGFGKLINDYGEYKGEFLDGVYHGLGHLEQGDKIYEGYFENGIFIKGKVDDWLYRHFYEGEYDASAEQYSGFGRLVYGDGEINFGEFKNGALNGIGVTIYSNGETYIGIYKDGSPEKFIDVSSFKTQYLFLNIKANGLPKEEARHTEPNDWPRIVQIGWILYEEDGTEITRGERIIRPEGFIISKNSELLPGISQEEALAKGVSIKSFIKELELITSKTRYIGGHDVKFVKGIIVSETIRNYSSPIFNGKEYFCTKNGRLKNEKYKDIKLSQLYKNLEYGFDESKSALTNAIASGEFYWKIKSRFKEEISSTTN